MPPSPTLVLVLMACVTFRADMGMLLGTVHQSYPTRLLTRQARC